jgi:hypothetical protein
MGPTEQWCPGQRMKASLRHWPPHGTQAPLRCLPPGTGHVLCIVAMRRAMHSTWLHERRVPRSAPWHHAGKCAAPADASSMPQRPRAASRGPTARRATPAARASCAAGASTRARTAGNPGRPSNNVNMPPIWHSLPGLNQGTARGTTQ